MKLHFITSNSRFLQLKRMTLAIVDVISEHGNYISSGVIHKLRSSLIARDRGHFQGLPDPEEKKKIPSRSPYPERFCSPLAITSFQLPFRSFRCREEQIRSLDRGSIHALHAPVLPLDRSSPRVGFLLDVVTKRFGLNALRCLLAFRLGRRK